MLIYQPHFFGRKGLMVCFAAMTLFILSSAPSILDTNNLSPARQADTPEWVPLAFIIAFLCVLVWNAYWFLVGSATEARLEAGTLSWENGVGTGEMRVEDITAVGVRFKVMPTIYSDTARVGLFPARGLREFVDAITADRPELRPAHLGLLSVSAERRRRKALRRVEAPPASA